MSMGLEQPGQRPYRGPMSPCLGNRNHLPCPPLKWTMSLFVTFLALSPLWAQEAQQDPLVSWMNKTAQQELQERAETIHQIHTIAQAEQRKQVVHTKLLEVLGGLPDYRGPLNPRITGQLH